MAQYTWTYYNNQELPSVALDPIKDETGTAYDFSSGWTFAVRLCRANAKTTTLLLKTTGITGSSAGVVTIAWATTDWDGLAADTNGTQYVVYLTAARTSDSKTVDYKPSNPPTLLLKAAPGTSAVAPGNVTVTVDADTVTVDDVADYFTGTNVEAVLAEVAERFPRTATPAVTATGDSCGTPTYPMLVAIGDSLTANNESATTWTGVSLSRAYAYRADGYLARAMIAARQPCSWRQVGTSGDTTTMMLARFDADVIALRPQIVLEAGGTNDVREGVSAATIFANKVAMWNKAYAIGAKVIATTVPPASDSSTAEREVANDVNAMIREYARTNTTTFTLVDWFADYIDPLTGGVKTSVMDASGVHPNSQGAYNTASKFANAILGFTGPIADPLPSDNVNDLDNFMNLPLLTGTTGTGSGGWSGVNAGGWFASGNCVTSKVARSDGLGDWLQMACTGTTTNLKTTSTRWAVGDYIYAACEFETDSSGWVDGGVVLKLYCFAADGTTALHFASCLSNGADATILGRHASGVLRTPIIQIPATTSSLRVDLQKVNAGTVRFGRVEVRKLA